MRFEPVEAAFRRTLETGEDLGASFCVTVEGETVVDLWGGWADEARARPWAADTIVNVFSVTKTMTALTALLLADRGVLDLEAPVARYWPAFSAAGKAAVTLAQVLSHAAGLQDWTTPLTTADLYDWDKATTLLARQAPAWEPGTAIGYHSMTQGYLVGEVVRRATGRTLGTVFRQEIAEPLGADFHIGLPASEDGRVADLTTPPPGGPAVMIDVAETRTRAWRGAEIPAVGGTGNARAIAGIHAILANGGLAKGRRFLSEAGCQKAFEVRAEGRDQVLGMPMRWGLGFAVGGGALSFPNPNTIFWGGYGGALAIIDADARTTLAYAMNRMGSGTAGDLRGLGLAMAAWEALGVI